MNKVAVKFSYFGYSVNFATAAPTVAARRAEANALIVARYGAAPELSYVEHGLPFPDYVPMLTWDAERKEFN